MLSSSNTVSLPKEPAATLPSDSAQRREISYSWELANDKLAWSEGAKTFFGLSDLENIDSYAAYAKHIRLPAVTLKQTMQEGVRDNKGVGVPYSLRYAVRASDQQLLHIEDKGRWFGDAFGNPAFAHGYIRVTSGRQTEKKEVRRICDKKEFMKNLSEILQERSAIMKRAALFLVTIKEGHLIKSDLSGEIIAEISNRITKNIRKKDLCAYLGKEKWAIIAPNALEALESLGLRLIEEIGKTPLETPNGLISLSGRIGATVLFRSSHDVNVTPQKIFARAQSALNFLSRNAHGVFCAFSHSNPAEAKIRRAEPERFHEKDYHVALSPVLRAKTRKPAFYKCQVFKRGMRDDAKDACAFTNASDLQPHIDLFGLDRVVAQLTDDPNLSLSIKIGEETLLHEDRFTHFIERIPTKLEISRRIILEIDEKNISNDPVTAAKLLRRAKKKNVRLAISDFGVGYASFQNLRILPIDLLKIDRAFQDVTEETSDDRFFITTTLELAKHLGVETVAEQVQTKASANMLAELGFTYLQGDVAKKKILSDSERRKK